MGSCEGLIAVEEPSGVEEEPASVNLVESVSEQAVSVKDDNVESCGVIDKCKEMSVKTNSVCASLADEKEVHPLNVDELGNGQKKEEVLQIEKLYQNNEPSDGSSGVEDAGGLDASSTSGVSFLEGEGGYHLNVETCEGLDKFGGILVKENSGCVNAGEETGVDRGSDRGLVDEQEKKEAFVIEKIYQNKDVTGGTSAVADAGELDVNNISNGCFQKGWSHVSENSWGICLETFEVGQKLMPLTGSAIEKLEQDEDKDMYVLDKDNDKCVSGVGVESVVEAESKSDTSPRASLLHSQASEISGESSSKTGLLDRCDQKVQQNESESTDFFLEKLVMDGKRDYSSEKAGFPILMLQSQGFQRTSDSSGGNGGNYALRKEQSVEKTEGPSGDVRELSVDNSNTIDDNKAEFCQQDSTLVGSPHLLKDDIFNITPNYSSIKLDVPDDTAREFVSEINHCSTTEVFRKLEITEGISSVDHVSGLNCDGVLSSISQGSCRVSKRGQKNRSRRVGTRKRTNGAAVHPNEMIDNIFKFQRRKRSCLSKLACSSIWGSMDHVTNFFGQGSEASAAQEKTEELPTVKGRQVSRKCSSQGAGRSKRGSREKNHASSTPIRLRVKFGKEASRKDIKTVVPDVIAAPDSTVALHGSRNYSSVEVTVGNQKLDGHVAGDNEVEKQVQLLNVEQSLDISNLDTHHDNKDLVGTLVEGNSAEDIACHHVEIPSKIVSEGPGSRQNVYVDAGTSPDSEVINVNPEAQDSARCQEDLNLAVVAPADEFASHNQVVRDKTGKLKGNKSRAGSASTASKVSFNRAKSSQKSDRAKLSKKSDFKQQDLTISSTYKNTSSKLPRKKEICAEQLSIVSDTVHEVFIDASTNEGVIEDKADLNINVNIGLSQTQACSDLHCSEKVQKLCNKVKSDKEIKPKASNAGRSRRGTCGRQKKSPHKIVSKSKMDKRGAGKISVCEPASQKEIDEAEKNIAAEKNVHVDVVPASVTDECPPSDSAWVSCDKCRKWRRIPHSLLGVIERSRWVCENNMDRSFANCSIPQEKTNEEINAELGYSDPSCEEDVINDYLKHRGAGHTVRNDPTKEYRLIRTNEFLHRGRKSLIIDEIMVCHCKPQDGHSGCGDGCLNRMLSIECVKGTCPCGDLCSNQQFQRRQWAKLGLLRCGKKGYGLKSLENISEGQFLIEYVGEVLDMRAYEDRQKAYAQEGHKHFYFMTLNGGEVIDACKKGNIGRFINHSCEPNCRTEKWMVNGEICIGLFALRSIKKGEELTFDYNYVRVFGAAVKKCYCGSSHCQGYIGGDPLESEMVVQDDSDEEYSEYVILKEDEEIKVGSGDALPISNSYAGVDMQNESFSGKEKLQDTSATVGQLDVTKEKDELMYRAASAVSELHTLSDVKDSIGEIDSSPQTRYSTHSDEAASKTLSNVWQGTSTEAAKTNDTLYSTKVSDISPILKQPTDRKFGHESLEKKKTTLKPRPRVKTSRTSVKMDQNNMTSGSKAQVLKQSSMSAKPKKPVEISSCGRFEAVEVKLNQLLDVSGGIKKDAAKGYLKLLLLTAASGDSNGDKSIQSNRDLSMILDALLKTKSRTILTDVINKNGLRMLHNIIKQYRRDFLRIPILRKLMKVLEYLSIRGVLTLEHISSGPPCPGMESFRESMLSLTEHIDKQIHQIARNFRDRWIPKPLRKLGCMDKDDSRMDFHKSPKCNSFPASQGNWHVHGAKQNETTDCVKHSDLATPQIHSVSRESCSVPCTVGSPRNGKRKSRWDQPDGRKLTSYHSKALQQNSFSLQGKPMKLDEEQNTQEDAPPGFSSPISLNKISSSVLTSNICDQGHSTTPIIGHPQAKFISRSPVSYGIPISVLEQFGTCQNGSVDDWLIAPGIPFSPFPPLPKVPRDKKDHLPSVNPMITGRMAGQKDNHVSAAAGENIPSTSGAYQSYVDGPKSQHTHKRPRGFSCDLGRRYFKQQKGPNTRFGPPWLWKRNGWGFMGNNSRDGMFCSTTPNGQSSFCLEDEKFREEREGSHFYQQLQHQNRY